VVGRGLAPPTRAVSRGSTRRPIARAWTSTSSAG
jgi:hypothetical protein